MIYPRHIPLTERKSLCARLIYLDAVHQLGVIPPSSITSYKHFTGLLLDHITLEVLSDKQQREKEVKESAWPGPLKALDLSLRDAINSFKHAPAYVQLSGDLPSKKLMKSVTDGVSSLSCQQCSPSGICEGVAQVHDDGVVHQGGDCISQLRQMFAVARDAALSYYAEYAQYSPAHSFPDIVLSTGRAATLSEREHPLHDFHAGAVTKFVDEPGQARSEAKLILMIDDDGFKLDLYTYKGILYVLFHECIAHAFYGLLPTFQDRKTSDPSDPFSEGFMDQVAYDVLTEAVQDTGLAKKLNLQKGIVFSDTLRAAGKMYFERNVCDIGEVATNKANLALGVEAAETTVDLIREAYKTGEFGAADDFKRAFYGLAFDLNIRRDIDPAGRRGFVTLMYTYRVLSTIKLKERNDLENLALVEIYNVIIRYLRSKQITQLVLDANMALEAINGHL